MAATDLYEVVLKGFVGAKPVVNVFNYFQTLGSGDSSDLYSLFGSFIGGPLAACLHTSYVGDTITVKNLTNLSDAFSGPSFINGSVGGEGQTNFTAIGFTYKPIDTLVRPGGKRFGPISEDWTASNTFNVTKLGFITALQAVLEGDIVGAGDEWQPVLFSPANLTHPAVDIVTSLVGIIFKGITSQVSRKL